MSPSLDMIRTHMGKKQGKIMISFKLDTYEGKYFSKVITMDKSIFNKYIKENTFTLPNKLRDNCLRTQWIYIRFL